MPVGSAEAIERQLVEFIASFKLGANVREEIMRRLNHAVAPQTADTAARRQDLEERLKRARDVYELGDLPRPEYIARRAAIHAELAALTPQPTLDLDHAPQVLEDFAVFWQRENDPSAKRQFLQLIFDGIWLDDHRVVAVQPKPSFLPFFQQQRQRSARATGVNDGSDGGPTLVRHPIEIRTRSEAVDRLSLGRFRTVCNACVTLR
jgi:hypothetical protein